MSSVYIYCSTDLCSMLFQDDGTAMRRILKEQPIPLPPGQWRVAMPAPQAVHLFIRFACKGSTRSVLLNSIDFSSLNLGLVISRS